MPKKSAKTQSTQKQEDRVADEIPKLDVSQEDESAAVDSEAPPEELSEDRKQAIFSELVWIAETWMRAIEKKDWSTLVDMVGLPEIFITGHPQNAQRVARHLSVLTRNLCDFEPIAREFYRQQVAEDSASFSFRFDVLWSSTEDWDEHKLEMIVHLGLKRSHEAWVTTYLLCDHAPRPQTQAASLSAPAQPAVQEVHGITLNQPNEDAPPQQDAGAGQSENRALTDDQIAEAAAQYFAGPTYGEVPQQQQPARGKKQLIYVPVLMDADLIRDLLS